MLPALPALLSASDCYLMPEPAPYTPDAFVADARAAHDLALDADADLALQRICAYFWATYGQAEGGRRYLRFGAVQAAIAAHWEAIVATGQQAAAEKGHLAPDLLERLLACRVRVNPRTREAWIAPGEVQAALRQAGGAVGAGQGGAVTCAG